MKNIYVFVYLFLFSKIVFSQNVYIVFRNDDISANSNPIFEYEVLQIFRKYNIIPLYSVIPAINGKYLKQDMAIVDSLKAWYNRGWIDIAMHGYTHDGTEKFGDLNFFEQDAKIRKGKEILYNALGIQVKYFCPPWNSANVKTLQSLKQNNISVFSGYLGEKQIDEVLNINCNCNLIDGPLGDFSEIVNNIKYSSKETLLIPLYHTNYDFESVEVSYLDSLLACTVNNKNVKIVSFKELSENDEYKRLLYQSNLVGYHFKSIKYNKYIRMIFLKIPFIKNYIKKQITIAEIYYWKGNYAAVNQLFTRLLIMVWIIVSIILIAILTLLLMYLKSRSRNLI